MYGKFGYYFFLILALLALAGCTAVGAKTDPNTPITVKVTTDEFSFKSSLTTFSVGQKYHFEVINKGKVPHEIMFIQPIQPGNMGMEEMDEMSLAHITEEDLQPGTSKTVDYTFTKTDAAKKLEFACHVPGHYEAGMKLPITVK